MAKIKIMVGLATFALVLCPFHSECFGELLHDSLVANGDFESGTDQPEYWTVKQNTTSMIWTQDEGLNNSRCLKIIDESETTQGMWSQSFNFTENTMYRSLAVRFYWKCQNVTGGNGFMRMYITFKNGSTLTGSINSRIQGDLSEWQMYDTIIPVPSKEVDGRILWPDNVTISAISGGGTGTTGTMWIDDVSIAMLGTNIEDYLLADSFWPNPGFEEGESRPEYWNSSVSGDNVQAVWDNDSPQQGMKALKIQDDNPLEAGAWCSDSIAVRDYFEGSGIKIRWNWRYEILSNTTDDTCWRVEVRFRNADGALVPGGGDFYPGGTKGMVVSSLGYEPFDHTFIDLPANANNIQLCLYSAKEGTGSLWVDNVSVYTEPHLDPIYVYILAGQSNMRGAGAFYESLTDQSWRTPQADVMYFSSNNDSYWRPLEPNSADGTFGPEVSFGRSMADANDVNKIAIVKHSAGGTSLYSSWASPDDQGSGSGPQYINLMKTYAKAISELDIRYKPVVSGMLWMQGETDAMHQEMADAYEQNLKNFIRAVRRDFDAPNMPFVIGRITEMLDSANAVDPNAVREAQFLASRQVANTAIVNTDDLNLYDALHYDADSQIMLGRRFAEKMLWIESYPCDLDRDGNTDMADFAVFASFWKQAVPRSMDIDKDGLIDIADLNELCNNWLVERDMADFAVFASFWKKSIRLPGDINEDGCIDISDLNELCKNWLLKSG